jgi:murein DD-endopeptidase MepM/ murein hydrolase activator NlpD
MNPRSDQLQNLADALSEDVVAMSPETLAAEAAQEHGDSAVPSAAFDRIVARAERQARWRRLGQRLRALVPSAALRSWRPAMAAAAGVAVVVVVGDVYLKARSDAPSPVPASAEHFRARKVLGDDVIASQRQAFGGERGGEVRAPAPAASPAPQPPAPPAAASADAPRRVRTVPIREAVQSPAPPPLASDASRVHTVRVRPAAEGPGPPLAQSAAPMMGARSLAFAEGERAGAAAIESRQSPGLLPDMRVASAPPPATAASQEGRDRDAPSFTWPVRGQVIAGAARAKEDTGDSGIDIAVPVGTEIRASADGVVVYAGDGIKRFGNLVLVRHDGGFVSAYAHLDQILVKLDDHVQRGQVIAKSGRAGAASTPLLHFEIRKGEAPVDARQYLPPG